jgi:hypothetical protein
MDILEQFLYSISYKFPKGYPDIKMILRIFYCWKMN